MASFERETRIAAPLERVWDFHSRVKGLIALTPRWWGLEVDSVVDPAGNPDPKLLIAGSEVRFSVRPCRVGPRSRWHVRIVDREKDANGALFRDEMLEGPFDRWVHTHAFFADDAETLVRDTIFYSLSDVRKGRFLDPFVTLGLEPVIAYRHRRARELLE